MRAYAAIGPHEVDELRLGRSVTTSLVVPVGESDDEEFAALEQAASQTQVVAAVDVDAADSAFTLDDVAAFHVDADGSGHLQWFARQECDAVMDLLD
jgi:hypothetical protein